MYLQTRLQTALRSRMWTIWVYGFYIVHNVHKVKVFCKALGTLLQSVDIVGNLDGHFKSLAYNMEIHNQYFGLYL